MAEQEGLQHSPVLELAGRIPVNLETQNVQRGGRNYRPPKWFQFIPRSVIGTPWLEGLLDEDLPPRNRIILADEGGMGKTKSAVITINHMLFENPQQPILIVCPRRVIQLAERIERGHEKCNCNWQHFV